ncbi:coenzyme Q-binding protein COQ10 homolog, mitochondrial [Trichomycterus rosablanca]|uniref:coenzyme Q-binding protein COQ10 homolog, mitochondrial n=1 Tax=Trichomycterus rosablanca TaxID=2290929 RepID=UPI002F359F65
MGTKVNTLLLRTLAELFETRLSGVKRKTLNQAKVRNLSLFGSLVKQHASLLPSPLMPAVLSTRNFINLAVPITARRMEYFENRTIGYSAEQIYNIVASVDQYQYFVPWCKKSKVMKGMNGDVQAQLEIGFPPFSERYISEVTVIPNHQVRAVCTNGSLFSHLETLWQFTPGPENQCDSCNVEFYVSFEFKSLLHSQLATVFFDEVVKQMVNAFEMRAAKLYSCSQETSSSSSMKTV